MKKKKMTAAMDKQYDKTEAAFPDSKFPPRKNGKTKNKARKNGKAKKKAAY